MGLRFISFLDKLVKMLEQDHPSLFPSTPHDRLDVMLASFNASPKATTLLLLKKALISPSDLELQFRRTYRGSEMDNLSRNPATKGYCQQTLCPIGLVAKDARINEFGRETVVGYTTTDLGEEFGKPCAAAILDFEQRNNFSIYPIFGLTSTTSQDQKRAPLTRALLLVELVDRSKRLTDLASAVNQAVGTVGDNLIRLAQVGVIKYDSVRNHTGRRQVTYNLGPVDTPLQVMRFAKLTPIISELCRRLSFNQGVITQELVYKSLPDTFKATAHEERLRSAIRHILAGLRDQEFLVQNQLTGSQMSKAEITPKGKQIVHEMIHPLIDALGGGSTLRRWQATLVPKVLAELPAYARTTGDLYYPYSRSAQSKVGEETKLNIMAMLEANQGNAALIREDITSKLDLPKSTVGNLLRELEKEKKIKVELRKGAHYYSL